MSPTACVAQQPEGPFAWSRIPEQCDGDLTKEDLSPCEQPETLPSSPSPARVFSPVSSPSSQSSISDISSTLHHDSLLRSQRPNSPDVQLVETSSLQPIQSHVSGSAGGSFKHPRRTQTRPSWTRPSLVRQDCRRQQLVEQLVDAATQLVALVWPESDATKAFQNRVISLRFFIRETLRRSRTSYSTLQVTLWYLVLIKPFTTAEPQCEVSSTQTCNPPLVSQGQSTTSSGDPSRPLQCGRRMFLSALILASKFLQDRNYTARAWSKITGLPTQEIISNEFLYLTKISWNLHLKEQDFTYWNNIIIRCTESTQLGRNVRDTWSTVLDCVDRGCNLRETARTLSAQHKLPVTFKDTSASALEKMCDSASAYTDRSPSSINFPPHASPLSSTPMTTTSSSPLMTMVEPRAATPSFASAYPLATPQSFASSFHDGAPFTDGVSRSSQDDGSCDKKSQARPSLGGRSASSMLCERQTEAEIDLDEVPLSTPCEYQNSRGRLASRAMRDPAFGTLTPSPSVGSDRCDEDGRSLYPSQLSTQNMSPQVSDGTIRDRAARLRRGLRRTMSHDVAAAHGPLAELASCPVNDVEKPVRAVSALQGSLNICSPPENKRIASRPCISEAEFYAAIAEKYRKQNHARLCPDQLGRKRTSGSGHDDRRPKSRCLESFFSESEMPTPTPGDSQPHNA